QVDHGAVRILQLRVALTPERVPWLLVAGRAGVRELSVQTVDVMRRIAAERDRYPVAVRRWHPSRIEGPDRLLGVERKAQSSWQRRLNMAVPHRVRIVGKLQPQLRVELDCPVQAGHDHSDNIQARHSAIIAMSGPSTLLGHPAASSRAVSYS